ncbi:hypothetical protein CEE45_08035 [Candidatus Heimdallarchaeota archaeon B3_Heim]|nr:MAG: hypothetical protein CEE45_08035 [Candidatus Heimdallarchaeota archaeon B3_Heim]
MVFTAVIFNGLLYTLIGACYLLIFMVTFDPRIWGYQDYPERIKEKIPPQTRRERIMAGLVGIPWLFFILAYPLISTAFLETELGGEIPFEIAFLNMFFMVFLFFLVDLVVLDWLIISKITPKFVIIDGTTPEDYKDFSHHYKGHLIASIPLTLICVIFSAIIVVF